MIELKAGAASLVLAPEVGGPIVGWMRAQRSILRPASAEAAMGGGARATGCFTMVPFSNRIAGGRFSTGGAEHRIALNFGDHPNAIHGVGWLRRWAVDTVARSAATLSLDHGGDANWPFAFRAEQSFTLTDDTLAVTLRAQNKDSRPAPVGFGLHPFFPSKSQPTLRFAAGSVWHNGPDMIPLERTAVPPEWDHRAGKTIGSTRLDNCFADWGGSAEIAWADGLTLTITADPIFSHLVVFTPPGADFFCVEPVTHANDAINRPDPTVHGVRILQPGETLSGTVVFQLSGIPAH